VLDYLIKLELDSPQLYFGSDSLIPVVSVYRVQGGVPPLASWNHVSFGGDGSIQFTNKTLNVSLDDLDHAIYFLQHKRPRASIFRFQITQGLYEYIMETSIRQKGYRSNPLNLGGTAPKIVDPNQPGRSFELPKVWTELFSDQAIPGSGRILKVDPSSGRIIGIE
jgi:hypothetical protein